MACSFLLFPPGDAAALRQALRRLLDEPGLLPHLRANVPPPVEMGEHLAQLLDVYRRAGLD